MYIYPTITINGVSSNTITGLLITSLPPISKPLQRTLVDVIDGRAGDVVTPLGFAAYDKPVGIALTTGYDIDEVISFFNSAGVVTFSNEPDKYYKFAIYEQIDFERLIRFKTATVVFHVQPYKYANNENPLNFAITSGEPVSVNNSGNTDSKPDLIITGEGVVNLDINGEQVLNIDFGEDEQTYIIDLEAMNAYATENAIKDIKTDFIATQASGTPTPSAPIPIVGVDKVNFVCCGKNLLPSLSSAVTVNQITFSPLSDGAIDIDGTASGNASVDVGRNEGVFLQAGTYYVTETATPYTIAVFGIVNGTVTAIKSGGGLFTLTKPTQIFVRVFIASGTTVNHLRLPLQLELGSTATDYEPYNGTTALINLGGTYYGGSVDKDGNITSNRVCVTVVGANTENWSIINEGDTNQRFRLNPAFSGYTEVTSSHFEKINSNTGAWGRYRLAGGYLVLTDSNNQIGSVDNLKAWLATQNANGTPVQFEFEVAAPVTAQASNTAELQAILGVNNVYSDAGDVEVTYKTGGVIHTETGEIVTFSLTPDDLERGAFVNRQIVGNYDNIKLKSGANTISLTGNATSLTVDKYSRWI